MTRHILIGYDGSDASAHALTFATELARAFDSSLEVLALVRQDAHSHRGWPSGGTNCVICPFALF
ncbi:MAG: universal stress protein [Steroidobacteraceae bacterium]